ncbi:MAG: 6-O-methylguanine DNA methyltransferase [Candidatus Zambryskibacteria bacterium CG10_big_fil_rev_8_21_14_0_10_42_12]|uniref:6-O-methylguanine DNA methyltransferase n=1 Tax=Candidatus Zambryskibacteria bacterium CG10_big_fil_rev_8_21_14_0_10_42_12 TaxID=1975115 RepID=A0A2H0QVV9_9BACT|nr:MAG: 6-O-methylguanine DNA methyltransferase [Candidatus Zambryskibacteria bacterium CG10_big_fil_rev_8_21_14_0_10_42_12]
MDQKTSNKISFTDRVYAVVKHIQKGQTRTYKEVAEQAGSPRAYRAVGSILSKNFDPHIPCHRVIKGNGAIGNYNRGGKKAKERILKQEGAL